MVLNLNWKGKLIDFSTYVKFLYDVGGMWFSLVTFTLLILSNSEKFLRVIPLEGQYATLILMVIMVPLGFLGVIFVGWIMVKVKFYQHYRIANSTRDPIVNETYEIVKRIEKKLK